MSQEARKCRFCKKTCDADYIYVIGQDSWRCGHCGKATSERGHGMCGRGPWCPQCQYEFNRMDPKNEEWTAACAAASGDFQVPCGGCGKQVVPVFVFNGSAVVDPSKQEHATQPTREAEGASAPSPAKSGGDEKRGWIRVISALDKLTPPQHSVDVKEIEVEPFVTAHATVSFGMDVNIRGADGFQVGKASIFISMPCYREEVETVIPAIRAKVRGIAAGIVEEAKKKMQPRGL